MAAQVHFERRREPAQIVALAPANIVGRLGQIVFAAMFCRVSSGSHSSSGQTARDCRGTIRWRRHRLDKLAAPFDFKTPFFQCMRTDPGNGEGRICTIPLPSRDQRKRLTRPTVPIRGRALARKKPRRELP